MASIKRYTWRYTKGRKSGLCVRHASPCGVWTGIVPPCPSYPQRITLWTSCENSVDCCAQPCQKPFSVQGKNDQLAIENNDLIAAGNAYG